MSLLGKLTALASAHALQRDIGVAASAEPLTKCVELFQTFADFIDRQRNERAINVGTTSLSGQHGSFSAPSLDAARRNSDELTRLLSMLRIVDASAATNAVGGIDAYRLCNTIAAENFFGLLRQIAGQQLMTVMEFAAAAWKVINEQGVIRAHRRRRLASHSFARRNTCQRNAAMQT